MKLCRAPLCSKPVVAKELCSAHYKQMQRDGRLHIIEEFKNTEDKFFKNIRKDDNGCWVWTGSVDKGYGRMYIGSKAFQTHRWSYEHHMHVSLPRTDTLDHLCRNTLCCNPEHLERVSLLENNERKHLYRALQAEIDRLRLFITDLGYNPDTFMKEM
jgi:hypothetical protein